MCVMKNIHKLHLLIQHPASISKHESVLLIDIALKLFSCLIAYKTASYTYPTAYLVL